MNLNMKPEQLIQSINMGLSTMVHRNVPLTSDNLVLYTGLENICSQIYDIESETFVIVHPVDSTVYIKARLYSKDDQLYIYRIDGNGYGRIYNYGIDEAEPEYID